MSYHASANAVARAQGHDMDFVRTMPAGAIPGHRPLYTVDVFMCAACGARVENASSLVIGTFAYREAELPCKGA